MILDVFSVYQFQEKSPLKLDQHLWRELMLEQCLSSAQLCYSCFKNIVVSFTIGSFLGTVKIHEKEITFNLSLQALKSNHCWSVFLLCYYWDVSYDSLYYWALPSFSLHAFPFSNGWIYTALCSDCHKTCSNKETLVIWGKRGVALLNSSSHIWCPPFNFSILYLHLIIF